jgi:heme A synthase
LLIVVVSAAGAVTALGDTLFPAGSLSEGVARDFSPTAHFLERLRVWHPVLAVFSALYIFALVGRLSEFVRSGPATRLLRIVQLLVAGQIAAGAVNLILLAPVFMQLLHLLLADMVWISLVLLAATTLEETEESAVQERLTAPA